MKMLSFRHLWEAYINLLYMYLMVVDGANANNCQLYSYILQAIKYWRWEWPGNKASAAIHNTGSTNLVYICTARESDTTI